MTEPEPHWLLVLEHQSQQIKRLQEENAVLRKQNDRLINYWLPPEEVARLVEAERNKHAE